ncbi:uncharacterized protein LOC144874506 [Branchiostoma floridae x Branchiostoma japonicum]
MDRDKDAANQSLNHCKGCSVMCAGCWAALCAIGLIVCGAVIAQPVLETKSLEFQETTCTTNNSYLTGQYINCECGEDCNSDYPCLRITVTYVVNNATIHAVLFDTESRLSSDGNNAENRQCVTKVTKCHGSRESNRADVLNFGDTYAPGQSYTCLYHPDRQTKVILTRLFTWDAMFHSMLWTSIGTFIFTVIAICCLCHYFNQAKKKRCSIHVPTSVPPQAPGEQSGYFITQPPSYSAGGENLPMHPPPQNLYSSE